MPVEQIKVGDRVFARNRKTGQAELMPVTSLIPKHPGDLLELRIEGEANPLRSSFAHPFWVKRNETDNGHWIEAGDLVSEELLETIDGSWRKIESVSRVEGQETVYNFTVDNDHDYFVGETGFLVHNAGPCGCHGNTKGNQYAELYKLVDKFGNFLKWGISQNAGTRYSQTFLNSIGGASAIPIDYGPRSEILAIERGLVETEPGPLNNEPWAGCDWIP